MMFLFEKPVEKPAFPSIYGPCVGLICEVEL